MALRCNRRTPPLRPGSADPRPAPAAGPQPDVRVLFSLPRCPVNRAQPTTARPGPPPQPSVGLAVRSTPSRPTARSERQPGQRSGQPRLSVEQPSKPRSGAGPARPAPGQPKPRPPYRGPGRFDLHKLGGARRDRTADLLLAKQALSQLSYGPETTEFRARFSARRPAQPQPKRIG
jgi:hypothetical protein